MLNNKADVVDALAITGTVFSGYLAELLIKKGIITKEEGDQIAKDSVAHVKEILEIMYNNEQQQQ